MKSSIRYAARHAGNGLDGRELRMSINTLIKAGKLPPEVVDQLFQKPELADELKRLAALYGAAR